LHVHRHGPRGRATARHAPPRWRYGHPVKPAKRTAALWNLLTFAAVATGLIWQLVILVKGQHVLVAEQGTLPSQTTRVIRFLSYFTVESNILVALTSLVLALNPNHDGPVWRVLRLEALFGITVTGIVYSTLLRGVVELHGAAAVTNALLHYVAPLTAVLGWLFFGPRPRITDNTLLVSLLWPAAYVAWTLAHGAHSRWFPYPFIDAVTLGNATAIRNGVALCLLLIGVGALFMWLDRRFPLTDRLSQLRY
jgi:hypothetical protein